MSVATNCPECDKRIRVTRFGIRIKCPHCESKVQIAEQVDPSESIRDGAESFDFLDQPQSAPSVDDSQLSIETPVRVVSTKKRRVKKRRTVPDEEPPNPFKKKWYFGIMRQRKILLTGEAPPSSLPFKLLAAYALVVTGALIYLLFIRSDHALESLPDLQPQSAAQYEHIHPDADLPPGHELRIGEARQFGSVVVRPLRITREPLEFTHYENESMTRPPDEPVLKLWLEFTIESGPAFQPLDTLLLTKRATRPDQPDTVLSNTFLCKVSDVKTRDNLVLNYEHPVNSEWHLKQQNIYKRFQPGDRKQSYVASDIHGYDALINQAEPLVWRLQIRKGLSKNGNGVTTLVDVIFNPDEITTGTENG